ncbi:Cof-type HAD-IIB family hydrolase [Ochrovirga pacifica]|uniref:Cof-type HAD-IIB family hydrolase n=1 Tax=Ochrovirga pacifica TaxID=1042376 RepID=UPI000255A7F6|nr:Cof-type HAD-IIB family hydrolase [Ochrovirga pacifica]
MSYKMIVLDMDDTLLTDEHTISDRNRKAIKAAQQKGVYVVLASGRPTPAMLGFARELELDHYKSFIISFNGSQIINMATETCIFEQALHVKDIHYLYQFSQNHKTAFLTYDGNTIVSSKKSQYVDVEIDLTGMPYEVCENIEQRIQKDCVKCLLLEEPSYLKTIEEKLLLDRPDLSISMSKPFFLEVMPKGIDKAATLKRLIDQLGISHKETIAVGNAGNDLTMVEFAGLGVWVANVTPELRNKADLIVASNNNDGVAEVIEKYILS